MKMPLFAAMDFETADRGWDSACAVGVVIVCEEEIVDRYAARIRPPREKILFSHIHGLTWPMLRDCPGFAEVWGEIVPRLEGIGYFVAHNAAFDRRVLIGCCRAFQCRVPTQRFLCTYRLARRVWPGWGSYRLKDLCDRLGIPLARHHDAEADAEASARLMMKIFRQNPAIVF